MGLEEPEDFEEALKPLPLPLSWYSDKGKCTYTTTTGEKVKFDIGVLAKIMEEIPEPPKILVMDIKVVMSPHLIGNMIILSKDVGEALEKAIAEAKT